MKYIQQAYKGEPKKWKYLLPVLGFFGLLALNILAVKLLNLDYETLLVEQIERKGANRVLFENLIPFAIFLIMLLVWVKYIHKQSLTAFTTSRKKVDWKRIFFSFLLWGSVTIVMVFIGYYLYPESLIWNFSLNKFLILAGISVVLIPFQTSFEEYFFRGYLMQGIGIYSKSTWVPLILTSVIFGLLHLGNPEVAKLGPLIMLYYIGTGLFLGIVTLMDEGLELALGFHAANNLIGALLITADWTAFQTDSLFKDISEPELGSDVLVPVFVFFPIMLFIFSKKYKWNNWKEKLLGNVYEPIELNEDEFIA